MRSPGTGSLPCLAALALALLCWSADADPAGDLVPRGDDFILWEFELGGAAAATAMAPDGTFAFAWDEFFHGKFAQGYSRHGQPVGRLWDLNPGLPPAPDSVAITSLRNNEFAVVWDDYDENFDRVIHGQRFHLDGTRFLPMALVASSVDGSLNQQADVDAIPQGFHYYLVTWTRVEADAPPTEGSDIYAASFDAIGRSGKNTVNIDTAGDQHSPAVSVRANSARVITWINEGVDGTGVRGRWFAPNGIPAATEFRVSTPATADAANVDVTFAPNGRFLVVWDGLSTGTDADRSIQGRLFTPSQTPFGPDFQINTITSGVQSHPVVEARLDSSFVVVWRSPDGVWGQIVDADGNLTGPESKLNSTESEVYELPTIAGALNGSFVVAWTTEDDRDYGDYRRARLFRTLLFADGFESGDTTAWNATVP